MKATRFTDITADIVQGAAKSIPLIFLAVFSVIALTFKAKFYSVILSAYNSHAITFQHF